MYIYQCFIIEVYSFEVPAESGYRSKCRATIYILAKLKCLYNNIQVQKYVTVKVYSYDDLWKSSVNEQRHFLKGNCQFLMQRIIVFPDGLNSGYNLDNIFNDSNKTSKLLERIRINREKLRDLLDKKPLNQRSEEDSWWQQTSKGENIIYFNSSPHNYYLQPGGKRGQFISLFYSNPDHSFYHLP